jgi:hypothetical protein
MRVGIDRSCFSLAPPGLNQVLVDLGSPTGG